MGITQNNWSNPDIRKNIPISFIPLSNPLKNNRKCSIPAIPVVIAAA